MPTFFSKYTQLLQHNVVLIEISCPKNLLQCQNKLSYWLYWWLKKRDYKVKSDWILPSMRTSICLFLVVLGGWWEGEVRGCRRKHRYLLWELIEVCVVSFIIDFQRVPINQCCLSKTLFQCLYLVEVFLKCQLTPVFFHLLVCTDNSYFSKEPLPC